MFSTLKLLAQYSKLIDKDPDLPATTALRQEMDTSSATNKNSYTQAIHSVLIELRERPIPETLDSPYVGTIKESREKVRQEEELKNSALTVARVQGYMIPVSELGKYGFMTSDPGEEGDTNPDALGEEKTCDRCREKFTVSDAVDYAAFQKQAGRGECVYHWGKVQPARQEGARVWLWTCCGEARDSEGCVDGLHVFRDGYPFGHVLEEGEVPEEVLLHRRKAFKTTYQIISELNVKQEKKRKFQQTHDIVALDCEMISKHALSEKIGVFIQNNVLEEGHDSTADARAALDLVKWKVKTDVSAGLIQ
ncbi:hypothetical protein QFC19_005018 [Naganishia cerealis]|uniref:Uncharacterized protein n=1 Tax=Naganishia cerealis TaxID=610337 RepID=A0ACC2VSQ9_9TREE|nr:hypothetical protein QFC19_005018 [Naganishia cerealis]